MKKLLALLLGALMLLGVFTACGGTETTPETTQTTGNAFTGEEYTLEREPGTNQLVFYWSSSGVDYSKCDMWIWYPNADGRGYLFHECAYGAKVVLNVPEDITEVGFIVRKNCSEPGGTSWGDATKDYDGDRYAIITGELTEIYLKAGDGGQYFSNDGGKTLYQKKEFGLAAIIATNQIRYTITPATKFTSLDQVKVFDGDRQLEIESLSSLNNEVVLGIITLKEELEMSKNYTVHLDGFEDKVAVPTAVFDSAEFVEKYVYDGNDLGATVVGSKTTFKVWAPTASKVELNLFSAGQGGEVAGKYDMTLGEKGVWSATVECGHGTYYTYSVTTALGTKEAVDPYARSAGVNGDRGMVVDLSKTDPENFSADGFYQDINAYSDAIIWEVHVRDFSNKIESSAYKGKYLAFTETGLKNDDGYPVGVDYLKDLGITHVHFQPIYDYATVDETTCTQFNWGYDPKNYNVPEGSYSTDPYNGEVRVRELKQMVQALHQNGMGVIMDVVYNHTYSIDSNLNRIVPYYYYRYDAKGEPSNGSGCGNETASERAMFRKYMVDSVVYWATEYHIDGFRFDLMALHDVDTMQAIESALHAVNPKAIIYGEGWTGGTTPLNSKKQANQANISQIKPTGEGIGAVAVFNDAIRDGLKGSVFDSKDTAYINGDPSKSNASMVVFGITGGVKGASWSVKDQMVINYMSCHDNNTLWDKLLLSNPDATDAERIEMYKLGAAIVLLSKGTPFFLAGEEMLRTKQGDHNSYNSSDEINNIDWSVLTKDSEAVKMVEYYKALINLRKNFDFLKTADIAFEIGTDGRIVVNYSQNGAPVALLVINPGTEPFEYFIGDYNGALIYNGEIANDYPFTWMSGTYGVPAKSLMLLIVGNEENG